MNGQAGKGDVYRSVDKKKFDENWERIFGKVIDEEFNRDESGDQVCKSKGRDTGQDQTGDVPESQYGDGDKV